MSNNIFYCREWFLGHKVPSDLYTEKEACKKHMAGEPYTALIGSDSRPSCVVEVTKGWVTVGFLNNDDLEEYSYYAFKLIDNNRLFLNTAVYREFAKNKGEGHGLSNVSHGKYYAFREHETYLREEYFNPYKLEENVIEIDLSAHYDYFPEFGKYDSLIKRERAGGLPGGGL